MVCSIWAVGAFGGGVALWACVNWGMLCASRELVCAVIGITHWVCFIRDAMRALCTVVVSGRARARDS